MKQTVRLQRGLYVLMDSYARPTLFSQLKPAIPVAFCLASICIAGVTLQAVEQRALSTCPITQRVN